MQQGQEMAREKQINFRVSADEAERFDRVAAHYGLPVAAVIRMLVKQRDEEITTSKTAPDALDDFRWTDKHRDVLRVVAKQKRGAPISREDIERALREAGGPHSGKVYGSDATSGRELNDLRRNGYLRKLVSGYVATEKSGDGRG